MYATPLYVCCGWQFERLSTTAFFPILHFLQVWLLRVYASVSSHDIWVSFNSSKIPFCVHNCHSSGLFTPFLVQYDWHESENESVQMFFFYLITDELEMYFLTYLCPLPPNEICSPHDAMRVEVKGSDYIFVIALFCGQTLVSLASIQMLDKHSKVYKLVRCD